MLSFWGAVFTLGLLLAFSVWLFAVARFLLRGFRWPRAGALVAQLFVLTIGFPTLTGGYPLAGLAMLVPAVLHDCAPVRQTCHSVRLTGSRGPAGPLVARP